ncbi:defects in morphology protein 1, precursor precursor domain-containing protein [Rhizoctonia solani AG-1 IA]|uniref:Defects in morphology protein 1, domain-containing protein n=1 Tax=Thanatephorus cucumeris (strain AG1-IA) TaxID=983506 RepID=L8WU78_THACA|nr:defects in morphology protein 1, precursor precursor domain-containing protein [Rhizoctonia solani AG-1 IA]
MNPEQQDRDMNDATSALSHLTEIDDNETVPSMTNDDYTETGTDGRVSPAPSLYSLTPSLRDQSFRHVHGRSLNAHSDVYSLPADELEAQRLCMLFVIGLRMPANTLQTIREVLAPTEERQRMALDLGEHFLKTLNSGRTIQCATDFPHVEVLGVDLAPTSAIAYIPHSGRLVIKLATLGLLNSGVKDYAGLVDQVSRCLRPGGLVIFAEFDFRIWAEDHRLLIPPNFYTPLPTPSQGGQSATGSTIGLGSSGRSSANASKFSTVLTQWAVPTWMATMSKCVRAKGGNIDAATVDVQPRDLWAPLGPWKAIQPSTSIISLLSILPHKTPMTDDWTQHPNFPTVGEMSRDNLINLMIGARPLLYGWFSSEEVAELEETATEEVQAETNPMYIRVQVTTAHLSIGKLFDVKNKIALVSGGGSGIGFMIASALVQNGAKVYIASRKEKQLQEAQKALNEKGPGRCEYIVADLGKEGWDRVMALNVKSLFYMTSGLSELLQKDATAADPGRVVNISSVAGNDPIAHDTGLANKDQGLWNNTSKAAVNHLTTTMAVTLAPKFVTDRGTLGAQTNLVAPGRVGAPTDMAGLFLFLVSPGGAHITGAHIESDGGSRISGREWLQLLHSDQEPAIGGWCSCLGSYIRNMMVVLVPKMSDRSDDEYEFTEFTEDELRSIDSTAEEALRATWPPSSSSPQLATRLEKFGEGPRSRKSSGFSHFELTEEDLQQIDCTVARLAPGVDEGSGLGSDSRGEPVAQSIRPSLSYVEVTIDSPVPPALVASPTPTLGRSPSQSATEMPSLYSQFRAFRNSLSVSDLVGPAWCEVQFEYGLRGKRHLSPSLRPEAFETRSGKKIRVQREVAVHKKLEREIRPIEVKISPKTREDVWGLKEMPVIGFVHGHFVNGVIMTWSLDIPKSPTFPGGFASQGQPAITTLGSRTAIYILDNKTRGVNSLPQPRDAFQSRLQLMLYRRLLDMLLIPGGPEPSTSSREDLANERRLSFHEVWAHHSLNSDACFSPSFLQESALLVTSNNLGLAAENAVCLKDLENVWHTIVNELIHTIGPGEQDSMISETLKLVYRRRGASKKRSTHTDEGSQPLNRYRSSKRSCDDQGYNKTGRAESEDVELQRAIRESLSHGVQSDGLTTQDETSEIIRRQTKDESQGSIQETGDPIYVPSGRTSFENDLQRAIEESKKSVSKQMGKGKDRNAFGSALLAEAKVRSIVAFSTCIGFQGRAR